MRRRISAVLVSLALLWQAVAVSAPGGIIGSSADVAHALLHWSEAAHHHHHDGSLQQDDSTESIQHLLADSGLHANALLAAGWSAVTATPSRSPTAAADALRPSPFIDGLRRPPRSPA